MRCHMSWFCLEGYIHTYLWHMTISCQVKCTQRYPTHLRYHIKVCNKSCTKPHTTLLINPWFSHEPTHLPGSRGSCHHFNSVAHCLYNQRQLHLCSFHLPGRLMCCSHSEGFGHGRVHDLRLWWGLLFDQAQGDQLETVRFLGWGLLSLVFFK